MAAILSRGDVLNSCIIVAVTVEIMSCGFTNTKETYKWFIRILFKRIISYFPVLGLVNPTNIGVTLTHEHLSMTLDFGYKEPPVGDENNVDKPLTLPNLGWVRQYP